MELRFQEIPGYAFGAQQPSVLLKFKKESAPNAGLENALKHIVTALDHPLEPNLFEVVDGANHIASEQSLCVSTIAAFNSYVGDIRLTKIKVFQQDDEIVYAMPTLSLDLSKHSLALLQHIFQNKINDKKELFNLITHQLLKARNHLPSGTNAKYFIKAAGEMRIPFHILDRRHIIYGYGAGSSVFNSTITERDSSIGVSIAKSKTLSNLFLQRCGFPVAKQEIVTSLDDAIKFAESVGYPVVIKPEREDQGRGVYPNLKNEKQLITSFKRCSADFKSVIAEKHVKGDVYRVNMFSGKIVQIFKKTFAYVIGDGAASIEDLIKIENVRRSSIVSLSTIHPIKLDQKTIEVLDNQGFCLADVPKSGKKIYTTFLPNSHYGSLAKDAQAQICKENVQLLCNASKTLALDCVGFDFISEDVSVPWFKNGAIICEANAQPQILPEKDDFHARLILDRTFQIKININVVDRLSSQLQSLFNKGEHEIVLEITVDRLIKFGCPAQYYDEINFQNGIPAGKKDYVLRMLSSIRPINK